MPAGEGGTGHQKSGNNASGMGTSRQVLRQLYGFRPGPDADVLAVS